MEAFFDRFFTLLFNLWPILKASLIAANQTLSIVEKQFFAAVLASFLGYLCMWKRVPTTWATWSPSNMVFEYFRLARDGKAAWWPAFLCAAANVYMIVLLVVFRIRSAR